MPGWTADHGVRGCAAIAVGFSVGQDPYSSMMGAARFGVRKVGGASVDLRVPAFRIHSRAVHGRLDATGGASITSAPFPPYKALHAWVPAIGRGPTSACERNDGILLATRHQGKGLLRPDIPGIGRAYTTAERS